MDSADAKSNFSFIKLVLARIVAAHHPERPESWLRLGHAYEQYGLHRESDRNLFRKAIAAYRYALSLKPDYAQAWAGVGAAHTRLNQRGYWFGDNRLQEQLSEEKQPGLQIAADAYQQAIKIEPDQAVTWNHLGFVYGQLDRLDDEVSAYRKAVEIKPDYVEAWQNLITVYYNRREFDQVAGVCQEAVKHVPGDAHVWYDLGYANQQILKLNEAAQAYQSALKLKTDFPGPWVNLGIVYAKLGRTDDAVRLYSTIMDSKMKEKDKFYLAVIELKSFEQGRAVLDRLKMLHPRFMAKEKLYA